MLPLHRVAQEIASATIAWTAGIAGYKRFSELCASGEFEAAESVRLTAMSNIEASFDALARAYRGNRKDPGDFRADDRLR